MGELLIRFAVGGAIVTLFSSMGDMLRPKSFAGLFGAAPSVALATLSLTLAKQGSAYAAEECRSMIFGAAALAIYSFVVSRLLMKARLGALAAAIGALPVWGIVTVILFEVFGSK